MDATDRLKKRIDSLQLLVEQRVTPDQPDSRTIYAQLQALRQAVVAPQLVINVVGDSITLTTELKETLSRHSALLQSYQINIGPIPVSEVPSASAKQQRLEPLLRRQLASASQEESEEATYRLAHLSKQVIGRNPAAAQILLSDELSLVSGAHADVQIVDGRWYVQDLGSRNGTFVNGSGQRLQDSHLLQAGDRISLGSPVSALGSASFIYEEAPAESAGESTTASTKNASAESPSIDTIGAALNCNILCVVLNLARPITETIQNFFSQAGSAQQITEIVVVEKPSGPLQPSFTTQNAQTHTIEDWLKQQTFAVPIHYKPLLNTAPAVGTTATVIQPAHGESAEVGEFVESLVKLSNKRFDRMLANRIKVQTAALAAIVEQQLAKQKASLQAAIAQLNNQSTVSLPSDFKETAREAQRKVSSDKDWFFRQVKNELMQAKTDILNDFKNSSVTNKLSQFISSMSTQASNRKGFCRVRLYTPDGNPNVHEQTMALINSELAAWVQNEWEKVATTHVDQGFRGLTEQSRKTLKIVPSLTIPPTLFAPLQTIDPMQGMQGSLVAPETEGSYPKQNIFSYLLKNLRGQLFGIVGLLSIAGGGFGIISGGRNTLMLMAAPVVIICLCFAFFKERKANQKKEEEKLKGDTLTYYQSIAKDMADRQVRKLTMALDLEDRKFKEALEQVAKVYIQFAGNAEQSKRESAAQLKDYSAQLTAIEKDCSTLQRLQSAA